MKKMVWFAPLPLLFSALAAQIPPLAKQRAITFEDFIALDAVSDPQISPGSQWVAFVVSDYSLKENRAGRDIWIVPLEGGEARQLTRSPGTDSQPRWAPDSQRLAFVSDREGTPQIYVIGVSGGEARKVSNLDTGVSNLMWSPDGREIAFSGDLKWPPSPTKAKDPYPTQVKIWDQLYYRHWDEWRVGKRSHLFVIPLREADRPVAEAKDLTPLDKDIPTLALGGFQDIAFTSDGRSIAFTLNQDTPPATGTNNDIFLLPVEGGPCPI